ncbi:Uncharacterized protein BP5553_00805 [Venustampulla echinocandica]|uniref:Nuclear distribution protein RO10 n=1 Tax=Venustampulla echinocandica TaxID=2656787 RepID=A0A370TZ75_9HELO|nr:Uncharacterized protein BP5553_00805 [Venustampulla echinocandica]RDL40826.1 Uncharacterized protein BP5553_00805 [Venustampulla echinocandica]
MDNTFDKTATETIDLLEARLRRIEYAVCGHVPDATNGSQQASALTRLSQLERSLHQLASNSRVIQDLLKLHSKHPALFQQIDADEVPTTLDTTNILSIVLASASSYPSAASRLTSILDTPIPPAELSIQLIELYPRIAKLRALQAAQNEDIAELRERSAALIQRWYTVGILGGGDSWAELEGRVGQVEQQVRRAASARQVDNV